MGVIAAALFVSGGRGESITDIPTWVPVSYTHLTLPTIEPV